MSVFALPVGRSAGDHHTIARREKRAAVAASALVIWRELGIRLREVTSEGIARRSAPAHVEDGGAVRGQFIFG